MVNTKQHKTRKLQDVFTPRDVIEIENFCNVFWNRQTDKTGYLPFGLLPNTFEVFCQLTALSNHIDKHHVSTV